MRYSTFAACAAVFTGLAEAGPLLRRQNAVDPGQITALAPELGALPNPDPNLRGDCEGPRQANGEIPRIPCACPPTQGTYIEQLIANIQAGHAVNNPSVRVTFPTGDGLQDKHDRITAAIITLQNLNGPGRGCPGVSTTLGVQSRNLDNCGDFSCNGPLPPPQVVQPVGGAQPAPAPAPAPAPPANNNNGGGGNGGGGGLTRDEVARLAPDLGFVAGSKPVAGTADCEGPTQPGGNTPRVPCVCPPGREEFINQLLANAQAGRAVKNPGVSMSFPLGDSVADKKARITASVITLQNLNGPGQGCPSVSTTLAAQSEALDRGGVANVSSTNNDNNNNQQQPQQQQQAPTPVNNAPTPTITVHTTLTSIITVTRGQAAPTGRT
ncbi:hypothetical protein FRB91_006403 [Serendipita sp. 411]|nr:hypothetical protein FRB91_006403 [Serendipita sp. 411]